MCIVLLLYLGDDLTSMRKAEMKILNDLENATAAEPDEEEREPAKKKKRKNADKENASARGTRKRKPLREIQVCLYILKEKIHLNMYV